MLCLTSERWRPTIAILDRRLSGNWLYAYCIILDKVQVQAGQTRFPVQRVAVQAVELDVYSVRMHTVHKVQRRRTDGEESLYV